MEESYPEREACETGKEGGGVALDVAAGVGVTLLSEAAFSFELLHAVTTHKDASSAAQPPSRIVLTTNEYPAPTKLLLASRLIRTAHLVDYAAGNIQ